MEGCLLIGGKAPTKKLMGKLLKPWGLVVAADSGLTHADALGLVPDEIIGDFDSIQPEILELYPEMVQHRHEREKDETDTELGLDLLRERGVETVHVIGGGGGRLDHLYAIISLFNRENPPDHWYTHREHILLVSGSFRFKLPRGKRVSFFPCGNERVKMKSEGLKWPLDNLDWTFGDFGISNVTVESEIKIDMKCGRLMMIYDLALEDRP